jgi:aspartyl-tRNA(Asn)/glutamyl-tRNA(Gln) amidotransferase subunit A
MRAGVKGLRIGVIEHFYTEDEAAHEDYVRAIERAAQVLRELGADVRPVRLPRLAQWKECGRVIQQFEQYRVHEKWLKSRPQDYSETARAKFSAGAAVSAEDFQRACEARRRLRMELSALMRGYDALMTLSNFELPCILEDRQAVQNTYHRHARMPFNVAGTPALSVPTGFTSEGLPLAMQLAGKENDEAMLYRVAWAYGEATGWTERHPSL